MPTRLCFEPTGSCLLHACPRASKWPPKLSRLRCPTFRVGFKSRGHQTSNTNRRLRLTCLGVLWELINPGFLSFMLKPQHESTILEKVCRQVNKGSGLSSTSASLPSYLRCRESTLKRSAKADWAPVVNSKCRHVKGVIRILMAQFASRWLLLEFAQSFLLCLLQALLLFVGSRLQQRSSQHVPAASACSSEMPSASAACYARSPAGAPRQRKPKLPARSGWSSASACFRMLRSSSLRNLCLHMPCPDPWPLALSVARQTGPWLLLCFGLRCVMPQLAARLHARFPKSGFEITFEGYAILPMPRAQSGRSCSQAAHASVLEAHCSHFRK